ncbi:alpha/beta hydrolase [Thiogranum longum]
MLTLLLSAAALATDSREENWFDDERFEDDLQARVAAVNGGDLVFLAEPPIEPVHHHHSRIILGPDSLDDGWVTMIQCHSHLDAVPRTQVLYHQTRTRDLAILSSSDIGQAWVEGHTVQLSNIGKDASLCIQVRARTLEFNEDGSFSLRGGPFMRRFLDGYYPMHVSMDIELPPQYLRLVATKPDKQSGFNVEETEKGVHLDTWFEGKLYTEVRFEADFCGDSGPASC